MIKLSLGIKLLYILSIIVSPFLAQAEKRSCGELFVPIMIREIDAKSKSEVDLVVGRMRETLITVLGPERGAAIHDLEWLRQRLYWHLDSTKTRAKVFLSENAVGKITGHAIARLERSEDGQEFGFFSTIFVAPEHRKQGIALALMHQVESWFRENNLYKIIYFTAKTNQRLITLFTQNGYQVNDADSEFVQLTKYITK